MIVYKFFVNVYFQLTLRARDNGSPRLFDTETVFVTVRRNLNTPQFTSNQYATTILETTTPGTSILRVTATDFDTTVSISSIAYCVKIV